MKYKNCQNLQIQESALSIPVVLQLKSEKKASQLTGENPYIFC